MERSGCWGWVLYVNVKAAKSDRDGCGEKDSDPHAEVIKERRERVMAGRTINDNKANSGC